MTSKSLVLYAHGSRHAPAIEEILTLAETLSEKLRRSGYISVKTAFLELAQPTLSDVVKQLIDDGIETIEIFPYFLALGNHVRRDIPSNIEELKVQFPQVDIIQLPYFGASQNIMLWIAQHINDSN